MLTADSTIRRLVVLAVAGLVSGLGVGAGAQARADEALDARVDALDAGVSAAAAVRAVKRLQDARAHYLEAGLWDEAAALYARDAAIERAGDRVAAGRDTVAAVFMRQAGRSGPGLDAGQLNAHLVMQPIVTLGPDGTTAKGTWHEIALLGRYGESARWEGGVYENDYALEDGVWTIARERFFPQYSGDYDEDGHHAPPSWNIPYHFVADHVGITIPDAALAALKPSARGVRPARLGDLAERVARLDDETAVRNLQHAYGYYLDRKMWTDVADLFARDGTFEIVPSGVYVGQASIRGALEAIFGESPLKTGELFDHILLSTVVTVAPDGERAWARTLELGMLGLAGDYARWQLGIYENELVREDGVWKIAALRYFPRMTTDYDEGWARNAIPAPAASERVPPDRPSAGAYASYPAEGIVALHFANPVTGRDARYPDVAVAGVEGARIGSLRGGRIRGRDEADVLARAERGLAAAIGVDAVENLMSSYGYYIDESAWDNMADTYARSGSKEITGVGVYVGPERIRTILNLRGPRDGRSPTFFTIHQLTQPVIHVADDGQSAKARMRLFQGGGSADASSGSWIGGIYENTAVFEDGEWKFGVQDLHHSFNASYRNGWARVGGAELAAPAGSRASVSRAVAGGGIRQGLGGAAAPGSFAADFPPDGPIRARQYTFPEIVEPAFHYANPVSGREPPERMPD